MVDIEGDCMQEIRDRHGHLLALWNNITKNVHFKYKEREVIFPLEPGGYATLSDENSRIVITVNDKGLISLL